MLTIRHAQREALDEAQSHQFALEMVEHLRSYSPAHAARIGSPAPYRVAWFGLGSAKQYGFTQRGPVRRPTHGAAPEQMIGKDPSGTHYRPTC